MSTAAPRQYVRSSSQVEDASSSCSHAPFEDFDMFCCHTVQDSLLSSSSCFTDYRGILNWIIILLVLTHAHLFLENFIQHGVLVDLWKVLEHLKEENYSWPSIHMIMAANIFAVGALVVEKWLDKGKLSLSAGHCLHLLNLGLLTLFPAVVILHGKTFISAGGALVSLFTYTILGLKLYSYQEVNSWYRQEQATNSGETRCFMQSEKDVIHHTFKDLYYFMLAPTLCYQRDFPHTHRVRINLLLHRLLEMVMLGQLMIGIIQQWIEPIFQKSENLFYNMDISTRIEHLVELVTPTHFFCLILFFLFLHSYLNFLAELLRFGDRQFYTDWWNAQTLSCFWRSWNVPFHKWTQRHLCIPLCRRNIPQQQVEILVFILSAALFEYHIALPLHTWHFWIFFSMVFELLVAFFLGGYFKGNYGNGLVWLCLLLGPPLAVMTYCHDYYISYHPSSSGVMIAIR